MNRLLTLLIAATFAATPAVAQILTDPATKSAKKADAAKKPPAKKAATPTKKKKGVLDPAPAKQKKGVLDPAQKK